LPDRDAEIAKCHVMAYERPTPSRRSMGKSIQPPVSAADLAFTLP
jgi:hypothetical protein